jgi:hypothetical protein
MTLKECSIMAQERKYIQGYNIGSKLSLGMKQINEYVTIGEGPLLFSFLVSHKVAFNL